MFEGLQERPAHEELVGVEIPLEAPRVLLGPQGLGRPDVEELPRVVPLVDRLEDVYALVALEPDEGCLQDAREDLGYLGLSDPGLALEKEGASQLEGEEDRRREPLVGEVVVLAEPCEEVPGTRNAGGQGPPAPVSRLGQRPRASSTALRASTRARCRRYSAEAAMSEEGLVPSSAFCVASATEPASAPESAFSAAEALKGVEPMLVSPMRAKPTEPLDFSTTAATPTTAQSWARRLNFL